MKSKKRSNSKRQKVKPQKSQNNRNLNGFMKKILTSQR